MFAYNTCQPKFEMNSTWYDRISGLDDNLDSATCPELDATAGNDTISKGYAYWIDDGVCKQSFGHPVLTERITNDQSNGFNLAFTSQQKCAANSTKDFVMTIEATCNSNLTSVPPI